MNDKTITLLNIFTIGLVATLGAKTGEVIWNKYLTTFFKTKVEKSK